MRVLLVHNRYRSATPGGEDLVFEHERDLLTRTGLEVATYTRSNDEMDPSNPLDSLRVLAGMQRSGRTTRELRAVLRATKPDVVHFHNTFPLISASAYLVCREMGVPIVQTVHNFGLVCAARTFFREGSTCRECSPGNYLASVRHRCYRDSSAASLAVSATLLRNFISDVHRRCIDRFIALTPFVAEWLSSLGVERERIVIKPNSVQVPRIVRRPTRDYAVFAGRLSAEKGVDTLLKAWQNLPEIPLKVFGSGPDERKARRIAEQVGASVEFMGSRPRAEVMAGIAGARVLVMPSGCYEAAVPLVILEAWALGTPVVATRVGSTQCILDGKEAIQFGPGDVRGLAAAVRAVWESPTLADHLIKHGEARFAAENTPEQSLSRLLSTYAEVAMGVGARV